jgi:exonuclease SbcD
VYTDALPQTEPMRRLRERFPHCAMVQHHPDTPVESGVGSYTSRLQTSQSDAERIDAFLAHVRGGHGATEREDELIREVLDDVVRAEALV